MVEISSKIFFGDEKLQKEFEKLKELNESETYKQLVKAFNNLKENAFCGIQIPKKLIPKDLET
jgi:hypothetical protein